MREENPKNGIENLASRRIQGVLPKKYHMEYRSGQEELVEEKSLQEIENMIRETSKNIEVPESLLPENMGRKLLFLQKKKRRRRRWMIVIGIVLFLCIAAFGILAWKNRHLNQEQMTLKTINSYEQLYDHYVEVLENNDPYALYGTYGHGMYALMGAGSAAAGGASASAESNQIAVSTYTYTNLREKGIGEGDFTVNDGKNIYTVYYRRIATNNNTGIDRYRITIQIHETQGEKVSLTGTIIKEYSDNKAIGADDWKAPSVYVYGDTLALVHSECLGEEGAQAWEAGSGISFYDISDRKNPKLLSENKQSGTYQECREVDGYFYVLSMKKHIMINGRKKEKESRYIPYINGQKLSLSDIYVQKDVQGNAFEMISTWNLKEKGKQVDVKAAVGYFRDVYVTENNIYLSTMIYGKEEKDADVDYTQITKLSVEKGEINPVAATKLPGTMDTSFALQEHEDELWLTVQRNHYIYREDLEKKQPSPTSKKTGELKDGSKIEEREYNLADNIEDLDYWYAFEDHRIWTDVSVYTLDENLKELDRLDGLARDEDIYAVRYVGETGYFISYKEVDPLVSVDLSDAKNIKQSDELVMPGFSKYLHPLQDDLMLGIGEDDGGELKVDLYDISDTTQLSRLEKKILKGKYGCSAFDDYKWFLSDEENQLVGFSTECIDSDKDSEDYSYMVYQYDRENGLELVEEIPLKGNGYRNWQGFRIGEYLYLIENQSGEKEIQVVELKEI